MIIQKNCDDVIWQRALALLSTLKFCFIYWLCIPNVGPKPWVSAVIIGIAHTFLPVCSSTYGNL